MKENNINTCMHITTKFSEVPRLLMSKMTKNGDETEHL
jgi:hypothetical protein